MVDIVLEVFRAVVLLGTAIFLWAVGRNRFESSPEGWRLIVGGFALLLFGSLLDITDNFESLNGYVVIGDTETEAFLEKVVGFLGGFVLLSVGLVRWMPRVQLLVREVSQRKRAEEELRKARDELEGRVEERTARLKAVNEALQESEALFRTVIDNLPVEIFIRDADGRFVLVNRAWEKAQGLSSEEAISKTARDIFPKDRADAFMAQDDVVLKTGQVLDREVKFRAQGASLFFHTIKFPIPDFGGGTTAIGGIAVDITERKRAEEALRGSEAQFHHAEKIAHLCHWISDSSFANWTYASPNTEALFGVQRDELLGPHSKFIAFVHPDDRDLVLQAYSKIVVNPIRYELNYRIFRRGGEIRHLYEVGEPETNDAGGVTQFRGTTQDVTELKRVEEEIRKLNVELEQRVEERTSELRAAQADLLRQERMATLGQLTATVSHELRNPLGVIRTSTSLLRGGLEKGAPRAWRALDRVERSVIRCDRIIDELLDYTRIQDLELELTPIETWMAELLDEQTIPSDIQLRQEFHLLGVMALFDRDRLRRAVINVLANACQAMTGEVGAGTAETERTLTVRTNQANGRIEIIFEDTGPGIPPYLLTKIFEPMFSTKSFGVGLGLPVVKQIMEQHDGGIEIESEDGRGTKVCLWLPGSESVQENPYTKFR